MATIEQLKALRQEFPGRKLIELMQIARSPKPQALDWQEGERCGALRASWKDSGFTLKAIVKLDEDGAANCISDCGHFTDQYEPGAIINPNYRRGDRDVYKYFVPDERYEDMRAYFQDEEKRSRSDSDLAARQQLQSIAKYAAKLANGEIPVYYLTVQVFLLNVELVGRFTSGIDTDDRVFLTETAHDLAASAIAEARVILKELMEAANDIT